MRQGHEPFVNDSTGRSRLSDVVHTVRSPFKLKRGTVHYDFATGKSSGDLVIAVQSGDTGSKGRDKRMRHNILESDRYPDIAFAPDHVDRAPSKANIHGVFRLTQPISRT
jgi:polyisoprenoid-binding protein YceI